MVRRRGWNYSEEQILINNYASKTIKELQSLLPGRDMDSINAKIKRLKKLGKIVGGKDEAAVERAYIQRGREVE